MGLQFLLDAMQDPNTNVRNTTAWTIGRIFEFVHGKDPSSPVINEQNLPKIMQVLLGSIKDDPVVAEKVCYALSQLFVGFGEGLPSSPVSAYLQPTVQALLETVRVDVRRCSGRVASTPRRPLVPVSRTKQTSCSKRPLWPFRRSSGVLRPMPCRWWDTSSPWCLPSCMRR